MSDGLSWAAAVDTSAFEDGMKRIEDGIKNAASNIEFESERIQSLFTDIPEINIHAVTNMPETADQIGEAYAEIARVQRINGEAINELSEEYNRLTEQINKFLNVPQKRDEVAKWRAERDAIKENIALRKEMIAKTEELTKVVEQNEKGFSKHLKTQNNVKMRIREVMQEMAALRNEAHMNGETIDESTGRYRELAEELGRLKDIQGDVATQAKILSNDENQFQGIISGLTGLSGGFTAAQGAMALFGSENENLQKVMTQLQAVMAITMGLQQVQQMLNKDSAFRLVTLNSLRSLWNKLMGESNAVQAVNNIETETSVAATEQQAIATETATAAEEANTVAQTANNAATKTGTAGTIANTTATEGATGAAQAHTGAVVANTEATKVAIKANKTLRATMMSLGIGAVVAGVGALVSWISDLIGKEDEATRKAKELKEINEQGGKVYAKAKAEISGYITKIDKFNGTQEEEKRLLKEVNDKYGEQFGYAKDLQEAKDNLSSKGDAYCRALEKEAIAQAYLNKYVEAYIQLQQVKEDIKAGKYHHWYNNKRGDAIADAKAEADAQAEVNHYLTAYQDAMLEAQQIRSEASVGGHTDPNSTTKPTSKDSFNPTVAARQRKEAINQWKEAVKQYIKEANAEVNQANIDAMQDGLDKELAQIQAQTKAKKEAWEQHLFQLATALKASEKAFYMAQKGHTEEGWEASKRGRMTIEDYIKEILNAPENAELASQYYALLNQITERGEAQINDTKQKYRDKWIKAYGSDLQKAELLQRQWSDRLTQVLKEAPELYEAVYNAMEQEMGKLNLEKFKLSINWDEVFGNLGEQSLQSLKFSLDKVKTYFEKAKSNMTITEIKDFQEAITRMEDEIASRNPFTALHKAFRDINTSKNELLVSLNELSIAQNELNEVTGEYYRLGQRKSELIGITDKSNQNDEMAALQRAQHSLIDAERTYQIALQERERLQKEVSDGSLAPDSEDLARAINAVSEAEKQRTDALVERHKAQFAVDDQEAALAAIELVNVNNQLAAATTRLATAQTKNTQAEQNVIAARNRATKSYKNFANQLRSAENVVNGLGTKARNLAIVFSDDIAAGMDKALGFLDEVLDASASVISEIGDVGKSVSKSMAATAEATGEATKTTAEATAKSISTIEKASVILTVISAALQIATAIANLFNDDDSKQKEIERLQERIDQLQWELDNAEAVRLQDEYGDTIERVKKLCGEAADEVLRMHLNTSKLSNASRFFGQLIFSAEIYQKSIEKIADAYAGMDYTATKALGSKKYDESRKQLENLAEQQILIQRQINEEQSKKKTDKGKVQDYKNKIAEIAAEMSEIINSMVEDIMGTSADNLSKTLGDAFFDAVAKGEDAMMAWAKTTKELVRDILKQMLVTKYLETEIGSIFNTYKDKWFKNGVFQGVDAVIDSADNLAKEINAVGETFRITWDALSSSLGDWFEPDKDQLTQEVTHGYATELSEETGSALLGRATAIADAQETSKQSQLRMEVCMADCSNAVKEGVSLTNQIHDLTAMGVSHLEAIVKNTAKLHAIAEILEDIKRNTDDI